jgi:hypothetical protein
MLPKSVAGMVRRYGANPPVPNLGRIATDFVWFDFWLNVGYGRMVARTDDRRAAQKFLLSLYLSILLGFFFCATINPNPTKYLSA